MEAKPTIQKKVRKPRVKKDVNKKVVKSTKKRGQPEILKKIQTAAKEYRKNHPNAQWKICIKEGSKTLKK